MLAVRPGKTASIGLMVVCSVISAKAELSISDAPTSHVRCADGICTATAKRAVLNAGDLTNLLAAGDLKVEAGSSAQDIRIAAAFGWTDPSVLNLDAARSVTVDRAVKVQGPGGIAVVTNDGGHNGIFSFGAMGRVVFTNPASTLAIDGRNYIVVRDVATLAAGIAANPSGNFALADNYDAAGDGTYAAPPVATRFTGFFEGLGNTISNLTINVANGTDIGFFADSAGTIADIRITNADVAGDSTEAAAPTGVLAGLNEGTITGAATSGGVTGAAQNYAFVGGLVGENEGSIIGSHSAASVGAGSSGVPGGLVGFGESGAIYASSATGAVIGGQGSEAGGLIGSNAGQIVQCFATGAVTSDAESKSGGFAGFDSGPISDSYATGNVMQQDELGYSAGFVAFFQPTGTNLLTRNYSTGTPVGGNLIGGFIGDDTSAGENLADNYWDMTTSGLGSADGAGSKPNDPGIRGLTSKQLDSRLPRRFKPATWAQDKTVNQGFPYLRANPPQR